MRFTNVGEGANLRQAGIPAILALLAGAPVWADPPPEAGTVVPAAVWTPKEFTFVYQGFTTKYSCDELQRKMRGILLELGARADLQVHGYGCTQPTAPDPFAGVQVRMNVLEPAGGAPATPIVPAQWKEVDLVANQDPVKAAAECELYDQIGKKVLPYFTTRDVTQHAACQYRKVIPGSTQLKAEVLVAGAATPPMAGTAAR